MAWSRSEPRLTVLPLPMRNTLTGKASRPRWTAARCQAPGVTVVALLPSDGPVPPPPMVVIPVETASTIWDAERMCTWLSMPPAVRIRPSPAMTSVEAPMTSPG